MADKESTRPKFEVGNPGRPKGSLNKKTLERLHHKRQFINRVIKHTDQLFDAQLDKAIGEKFLMVKRTEYNGRGNVKREWHEIVTDTATILAYLDGELEGNESLNENNPTEFYYISTKPADNLAIQGMLDRAYGKATEKVELGGPDDSDLAELSDEELNARIDRYLQSRRS